MPTVTTRSISGVVFYHEESDRWARYIFGGSGVSLQLVEELKEGTFFPDDAKLTDLCVGNIRGLTAVKVQKEVTLTIL